MKAIQDLAGARSDEGYDAFLKDMIRTLVEGGVTAYEQTLHRNLRGREYVQAHLGEITPYMMIVAQLLEHLFGEEVKESLPEKEEERRKMYHERCPDCLSQPTCLDYQALVEEFGPPADEVKL